MSKSEKEKPVYFTLDDKRTFLKILANYRKVFEDNDISDFNIKGKHEVWNMIGKEYNDTKPISGVRTTDQLRSLFKNMKRKVRQDAILEIERYKTQKCLAMPHITAEELACEIDKRFNQNNSNSGGKFRIFVHSGNENEDDIFNQGTTSSQSEVQEILVEPVITLESIQNSIAMPTYKRIGRSKYDIDVTAFLAPIPRTDLAIPINREPHKPSQSEPEPLTNNLSNNTRIKSPNIEDFQRLRLRMLRMEHESKKREAKLHYENELLRKEIAWKTRENAIYVKKAKMDEILENTIVMELRKENEILKNKLLKLELKMVEKKLQCHFEDKDLFIDDL